MCVCVCVAHILYIPSCLNLTLYMFRVTSRRGRFCLTMWQAVQPETLRGNALYLVGDHAQTTRNFRSNSSRRLFTDKRNISNMHLTNQEPQRLVICSFDLCLFFDTALMPTMMLEIKVILFLFVTTGRHNND